MSPVAELLVVLLVIYLSSCVLWVPRDRVIIAWSPFSGWTLRTGRSLWGSDKGGLFVQNPLPVMSAAVLAPFPLSISPAGISARSPESYGAGERAPAQFLAFDKILKIAAEGPELHVNGSCFVRTHSSEAAGRLKDLIERLQQSPANRESLIRDFLREALNFKRAEEELGSAGRVLLNLRMLCALLCAELFIVLPVALLRLGVSALLWFLAALVVTNLLTGAVFYKIYALCLSRKAPFSELAMMLLCFPKTVRACDIVSAELTMHYHPLTFAATVDKSLLQSVAGRVLAELTFSVQERNSAELYFRGAYARVLREQLAKTEIQAGQLLTPPGRQNPDSISYCPLCRSQYQRLGACADCTDMPLQPLAT